MRAEGQTDMISLFSLHFMHLVNESIRIVLTNGAGRCSISNIRSCVTFVTITFIQTSKWHLSESGDDVEKRRVRTLNFAFGRLCRSNKYKCKTAWDVIYWTPYVQVSYQKRQEM